MASTARKSSNRNRQCHSGGLRSAQEVQLGEMIIIATIKIMISIISQLQNIGKGGSVEGNAEMQTTAAASSHCPLNPHLYRQKHHPYNHHHHQNKYHLDHQINISRSSELTAEVSTIPFKML